MLMISQVCGIVGVCFILIAFYLIQTGLIVADNIFYPLMNLLGSWLLLFSLFYCWNLPSVLIEIAWGSISLYGIYKITRKRKKQRMKAL